jgi:hypothetical protein
MRWIFVALLHYIGSTMRPVKPPKTNPHAPRFKLPPGACDTHLHVYGPFDRYPLIADRGYDPDPHSTLDDYLPNASRSSAWSAPVIVTGSGNGTNNRITLDALKRMNGAFKGLALLDPAISDLELSELTEGGFSGFRIKTNGRGGLSFDDSKRMVGRTAGFNWHVELCRSLLRSDRRRAVSKVAQGPLYVRSRRSRRAAHARHRSQICRAAADT